MTFKSKKSFLARARTHLEELDTERATVSQNIAMSEKRLAELKALAQVAPAPQDDAAEVQQLRGLVSQLQTQIDSSRSGPTPDSRSDGPMPKEDVPSRRICSSVRQGDGGVDGGETQRSSSCHGVKKTPRGCEGLSVDDERSQRVAPVDSGTDRSNVNIGEHGEVILHQCGFLGVRVGEASHPGPKRSHQDNTSDDEPLVRSNVGRHVVPRPRMLHGDIVGRVGGRSDNCGQ